MKSQQPILVALRQHILTERALVAGVILYAFLASFLWATILPYNAAPDEVDHYNMDWYVAVHHGLPIYDRSADISHTSCQSPSGPCVGSYASLPPGGPLFAGALMDVVHVISRQPVEPFSAIMTSAAPLDVYMVTARLASDIWIALYILFLYLTSRLVFREPLMRYTALILGALIPQVTFIGAYANDDSIAAAAAAATIYISLHLLLRGWSRTFALFAGCVLSVLLLSKIDAYITLVALALCIVVRTYQEWSTGTVGPLIRHLVLAFGVVLILTGWWFVRNVVLYGPTDPVGVEVLRHRFGIVAPQYFAHTIGGQGGTALTILGDPSWRLSTFQSFWGEFDYMALLYPARVYSVLELIFGLGLAGLVFAAIRSLFKRWRGCAAPRAGATAVIPALMALLFVLALSASVYNSLTLDYQPQGRYLFAALIPVIFGLSVGFQAWSSRRLVRATVLTALATGLLLFNAATFVLLIVPIYSGG